MIVPRGRTQNYRQPKLQAAKWRGCKGGAASAWPHPEKTAQMKSMQPPVLRPGFPCMHNAHRRKFRIRLLCLLEPSRQIHQSPLTIPGLSDLTYVVHNMLD